VRVTAVRDGIPLHGDGVLAAWRALGHLSGGARGGPLVLEGLGLRSRERLEMLAAAAFEPRRVL
jgi:hypothetical protein